VFNTFDLYIQYANSEGFGLPQVEAAACGVPVMSVDYSAMSSVIRKLNGIPLKLNGLYKELETGCMRAVPDNDYAAEQISKFFSVPEAMRLQKGFSTHQAFKKHYQWDQTAKKWEKCFDSIEIKPDSETWNSPPKIREPANREQAPRFRDNKDVARWLISNVLCEPDRLNTYMESRLIRDLNYKTTTDVTGGMYFNEEAAIFAKPSIQPFSFDHAYDQMRSLCERRNLWEQRRMEISTR
jgi:hypothetical protein